MEKLYKFYWDCGRMCSVDGMFVADDKLVEKCIGHYCYFGEILGKHSEIYGTLEEKDLTVLTDDVDFITKAIELKLIPNGYDPITTIVEWAYDKGDSEENSEFLQSIEEINHGK